MSSHLLKNSRIDSLKGSLMAILTCLNTVALIPATTAQDNPSPKIVTTFLPIHLFTKAVVGDTADVEILISPGTEVHDYQATPADAKLLAQADVLVENGLGMEEFLSALVANAGNSGLQQIDASKGIEVIEGEEEDEHGHHEGEHGHHDEHGHHGHHHEEGNPHVWLDPVLAQQQVANIKDALIEINPDNADIYSSNADSYIQQLQQLDNEFQQRLAPVKGCKFITFHDAFPYLAQRYGLEQEAIIEIPEDSMTPKDIRRVQKAAKKYEVKALFTEPGIEDQRIQQISSDLNLPLEEIDPLESGETDPQYYFQTMRQNLEALERGCQ
ncbi:ABC-type metal ion transport system, periplasmic component/surface adhesin [Xenococcus sp. PCC 7305]|uniref:metal ABC transporter solute-binding protein, Zn/Mn family n=1 Tax=Xenococcus sp. PCC 7305 TaxID=102125 RepID=UPI0002ABD115|nr:zinc ABC transporter substrate-binding protein [Xenococcus sp. PCC 7305]ELS00913.1 ABC-type metal ion transport system, periplasmic component/surface adhesin [Xenococcus sp. PCC 7305]